MGVLTSKRNSVRAKELFEFTQGIAVDSRLARQEVRVQKAWARGLLGAGLLAAQDVAQIEQVLDEALELIAAGRFDWRVEDEDIHMNLERFVTERLGGLGKRMHAGRSRNDLIATTLRLFVHDSIEELRPALADLVFALTERAEKDVEVIVPGLTHVQHGQPIRHGHALAAHGWAFLRDLERLATASARALGSMPLGAAALAGTPLDIDLKPMAAQLGFRSPSFNSYDSVGDRDFIVEAIDSFASVAVHLSRLSEDCVLWSATSVGLVKLPSAWSTGSSIMPNKRNPDVPELTRAKSAHVMACASNAHTLLKSVPTSYGSDLHELKGVFMRALDELSACLSVFPEFVRGLEPDSARAAELARMGHILATEVADELVRTGLPFREAYAQVAALVEVAQATGVQIHELDEAHFKQAAPALSARFMADLTLVRAVERRDGPGGTSRRRVLEGIAELKRQAAALCPSEAPEFVPN